jgi:prepilin-type processing-associated H-X9-DG protein
VYIPELVCPADSPEKGKPTGAWLSYVANSGMPDVAGTDFPPDWPANGPFLDRFAVPLGDDVSLDWIDKHDGTGQTLMLSENLDASKWTDTDEARVGFVWVANVVDGEPDPGGELLRINADRGLGDGSIRFARPSSNHPGGVNVMYCDGRSEFLTESVDYLVLVRLMTPDDLALKLAGTDEPVEAPFRLTPDDRLTPEVGVSPENSNPPADGSEAKESGQPRGPDRSAPR